ncbi:MAG: hypothetical protein ICV51_18975 [Flavisolibacter sp.]|nr:hypothetical protein [Flavisolibacter sp.]
MKKMILTLTVAVLSGIMATAHETNPKTEKDGFPAVSGVPSLSVTNVVLNEGTIVRVRLMETLDSRNIEGGDLITLETVDDVTVNGMLVIKAGAKVSGSVMEAQKSGMLKKAVLNFSINYVTAVDGQNVPLTSPGINRGGKTIGTGGLIAAAAVNPVLIVIPGKNVTIKKGQEYNVYVARSMNIKVK